MIELGPVSSGLLIGMRPTNRVILHRLLPPEHACGFIYTPPSPPESTSSLEMEPFDNSCCIHSETGEESCWAAPADISRCPRSLPPEMPASCVFTGHRLPSLIRYSGSCYAWATLRGQRFTENELVFGSSPFGPAELGHLTHILCPHTATSGSSAVQRHWYLT